jgi:hydroxypyruvate isomerase
LINVPAKLVALDRLGPVSYGGWVGYEYRPAASTRDGLKWLERANKT